MKKKVMTTMALLLSMLLVASMIGITAFAASIELKQEPEDYADSHTYNVYQIFTGDVENGQLQRVKYGADYGNTGSSVPKSVLDAIEDQDNARAFAAQLLASADLDKDDPIATLTSANNFKATGLAEGYYLIVDTVDGSLATGDVYSQYIVQVLGDVSIDTKKDVPESGKKIIEDEHTEDSAQNPGVSDDGTIDNVSIGDKVTFEITAKIPAHANDYDFYYFIIKDSLSEGLTLDPATITVKTSKDNATLTKDTDYAVYTGTDAAPDTFKVALLDAKSHYGETITVTYQATLNDKAVIGGNGNVNEEKLEYSNNPNSTYDGTEDEDKPGLPDSTKPVPTGETPLSTTTTYTSGIKLQKLDQDGNPLNGAKFTIEGDSINKVVKNTESFEVDAQGPYWKLKTGAYTTQAPQTADEMVAAPEGATDGYVVAEADFEGDTITVGGTKYRVVNQNETPTHILKIKNSDLYDSTTTKYKKTSGTAIEETTDHVSQEVEVNADGTLNFAGLGAGTYTIKETTVPSGYAKAQDVVVVITFDNETKKFTATVNNQAVTADTTTNLFPFDVENVLGSTLPSTGGIGTTIFYIIGGALIVGVGVVLVIRVKRRA